MGDISDQKQYIQKYSTLKFKIAHENLHSTKNNGIRVF
jgi:hypothetical protein